MAKTTPNEGSIILPAPAIHEVLKGESDLSGCLRDALECAARHADGCVTRAAFAGIDHLVTLWGRRRDVLLEALDRNELD